jgi:arylformamidase
MDDTIDFADQAELNRQYRISASVSAEVFRETLECYARLSADAAAHIPCYKNVVYDDVSGSMLDVYHDGSGVARPVLAFLHGGYWRMLSKSESAFMAPAFVHNGITVAVIDYTLAPRATLEEIVRQVRAAMAWLYANGSNYAVDPWQIYVSGTSAGGHLAGAVITGDWHSSDLPRDIVKAAFPVSGLFDLRPLPRTFVNEWLKFDEPRAAALSPALHLPASGCPVHAFWGQYETPAFKAQSRRFADAWRRAGFLATETEVKRRHHFDVILDLADPTSEMARRCFDVILAGSQLAKPA